MLLPRMTHVSLQQKLSMVLISHFQASSSNTQSSFWSFFSRKWRMLSSGSLALHIITWSLLLSFSLFLQLCCFLSLSLREMTHPSLLYLCSTEAPTESSKGVINSLCFRSVTNQILSQWTDRNLFIPLFLWIQLFLFLEVGLC